MSKTAIINIISSLLFKTRRTVYANIAVKLNYVFDTVNPSLRFTPPPPIKFRANPLAERVSGHKSVLISDFLDIINQFFITFSRKIFFTIICFVYIFAKQNCIILFPKVEGLQKKERSR
ncbi:MAG: hypothetical protein LBH98_09120 [Chitinispirillales bacterium]|jgi:hypothetical protein|nr:hypothetical protein [Chitinispirillales bacterium]